jgi:hypothetical protein
MRFKPECAGDFQYTEAVISSNDGARDLTESQSFTVGGADKGDRRIATAHQAMQALIVGLVGFYETPEVLSAEMMRLLAAIDRSDCRRYLRSIKNRRSQAPASKRGSGTNTTAASSRRPTLSGSVVTSASAASTDQSVAKLVA